MKIAELYANLFIKGGKDAAKELSSVNDSMISVSKKSLAVITALTGVSYGFKYLYDNALRSGASLDKFSGFTGESAQELQKWQYAAKQSNVAAEEMESNIKSLQQSINGMRINGPTNEFQKFADVVDLDWDKVTDTFYMMEKMKEFSRNEKFDTGISNQIMGQMGMSPDVINFLRTSQVDMNKIPGWAVKSDGNIKARSRLKAAGQNLQDRLQSAFEDQLVKFAPPLIKAITDLIPEITQLTKGVLQFTTEVLKLYKSPEKAKEFFGDFGEAIATNAKNYQKPGDKDYKTGLQMYKEAESGGLNMMTIMRMITSGQREDGSILAADATMTVINNNTFNGVNEKTIGKATKYFETEIMGKMQPKSKARGN